LFEQEKYHCSSKENAIVWAGKMSLLRKTSQYSVKAITIWPKPSIFGQSLLILGQGLPLVSNTVDALQ